MPNLELTIGTLPQTQNHPQDPVLQAEIAKAVAFCTAHPGADVLVWSDGSKSFATCRQQNLKKAGLRAFTRSTSATTSDVWARYEPNAVQ